MALLDMSPNIQESEVTGRKRSHDEFAEGIIKLEGGEEPKPTVTTIQPTGDSLLPPVNEQYPASSQASPGRAVPDRNTSPQNSPCSKTPTKPETSQSSASPQPASSANVATRSPANTAAPSKRKRLTPAEKESRDKELAEKKKDREEKAAQKAAEKAKQEEEKAAKAKEREEKASIKAAEKAKLEEEKTAKAKEREEKRKKKEEEQRKIQEEKDKKARSQQTLGNFFKLPSTPKKSNTECAQKTDSPRKDSPIIAITKPSLSEYERRFKPFFVKTDTRVASHYGIQMNEETRNIKSRILDECIAGKRADEMKRPFDPVDVFKLRAGQPRKRGTLHHPVRHIMEQVYKESDGSGIAGTDDANKIVKEARRKLSRVPMKVISFSQDVRPPYYGTVTFKPFVLGENHMHKLARRTMLRRLPLDYDYDSEAEWQEEEGEDLDMDDEEEELDDEEDMEEFLDDSEDLGLSRRIFANTLEPESTGICFEDETRAASNPTVNEHKMEFMHEGLGQTWGIDPFSGQYWEPEPKSKPAKATETATKMAPPPAPSNAFAALGGGTGATEAPKLVKSELMNEVKQAILDNRALSKLGIIDFIFHQFRDSVSRTEVKNTLEHVAEKKGQGRQKEWELKPGHEIAS